MKILVIDDHPVFREGLTTLLRQLGTGTLVLESDAVAPALAMIEANHDLDIVIFDLAMPGAGGTAAIGEIGRLRLGLPIIILSSSESASDARAAFQHGALGYVPKSASQHTLLRAIHLVLGGERYVPPLLLRELEAPVGPPHVTAPDPGSRALTGRQVDVLRRLASGDTNKRIALDLELSENTVKAHVSAILRTLGVVNRTQASRAAHSAKLI